ncbi:MAG: integron integrase [Candidatus Omnitrophica bacterium]|nr:integron integrase [Candidatus Omnitrophota bacterium]
MNSSNNMPADDRKFLEQLRELIRLKHFSYSTERVYLDWARRFFEYIRCIKNKEVNIRSLCSEDVKDFLTYLALTKRVSASSQNQAFNALLFLFRNVFKLELEGMNETVRAKRGARLPSVLTKQEVQEIFNRLNGNNRLIVQLLYGTGMRLMEGVRLRVNDIDFGMNSITVRAGKGDKDRVTMLPEMLKADLRDYLGKVKLLHDDDLSKGYGEVFLPGSLSIKYPKAAKEWRWQYVFPSAKLSVDPRGGIIRRHHITPNAIQKIVAKAVKDAGIAKHATVHTLRHSFATHLLMDGINIREVQELLGHKNVETTMIYTHVMRNMSNAPKSPLDKLYMAHSS